MMAMLGTTCGQRARLILLATTAFATFQGNALAQTSDTAQADASEGGPPDIIVTAQRRAEGLQNVPISITAVSGDAIREQNISDVSRLEQIVPGLRLARSGPAERPAIRGVYTELTGVNSDPRVGFYIDEIYQSRPQQLTATLVDLARVEVQKGPQGTLFGRNSYGGNIALVTATPTDKFEGGFDLTLGNYRRVRAEGFVNLPIAAGLSARIAAQTERHDGVLKSVVSRAADLADKDEIFVRGSLRWAPPGLGDRLEVLLRASHYVRDDNGWNNANAKVVGVLVDPALIVAPGGTVTFNGVPYTFAAGFNGLNTGTGRLLPFTNALRDNIPDINGADVGLPLPGPYGTLYDFPAFEKLSQSQFSGTISYDVSDAVRIRSITSYTDFSTVNAGDGDGADIPLLGFAQVVEAETFTQEMQIQSADPTSPFQYTLGGFYLNDTNYEGSNYYVTDLTYTTETAAARGLPVYYSFGGNNACTLNYRVPATGCSVGAARLAGNGADQPNAAFAKTKSYAVYAQGSYTFDERLTLTLGLRYTIDDKVYKNIGQTSTFVSTYVAAQNAAAVAAGRTPPFTSPTGYRAYFPDISARFANLECGGNTPGTFAAFGVNTIVGAVPDYFVTRCGNRKFEFLTYRAAVDYKFTPSNMAYASVSTGAHSGGFGTSPLPTATPQGIFSTFDTEKVTAFEVGTKNRFLDGRLQFNLAAFYNRYTGLQQQGLQLIEGRGVATIFNGPSGRTYGADLDIVAQPVDGLTLRLAVNYLNARVDEFPQQAYNSFICFYVVSPACSTTVANGVNPNTATSFGIVSGPGYYFPNAFTNPNLFVPFQTNAAGVPTSYLTTFPGGENRVQNTPDWSAQFGASYEIDLGRSGTLTPEFYTMWSDDYLLSQFAPNYIQESYFKTDIRLTWRSEDRRFTIQAFVNNVEDVATIGRAVTGSAQVAGTYAMPRTYGVRTGFRF